MKMFANLLFQLLTSSDLTGLLILNGKTSLEYLAPREPSKPADAFKTLQPEETSSNVYSEIFANKEGQQQRDETQMAVDTHPVERVVRPKQVSEALSAASHVLPPVSKLFEPFMEQLLIITPKKSKEVPEEEDNSDAESLSGELG